MTQTLLRGADAVAEGSRSTAPIGYHRRMQDPAHRARVAEATRLFGRAQAGDRFAMAELNEAMSGSDFPILFGDTLYRALAKRYADTAPVWQQWATRTIVKDFRPQKIVDLLGGNGLLDDIAQLAPYPRRKYAESEFEITVGKKGAALAWAWENGINDDLGAFSRAPGDLAMSARRTEDYTVTSVVCDASGPKSWLGTPATTALSADNLETGLQAIMDATDSDGNPIDIGTPVLMVPQALALTAQNIVNTTEVKTTANSKERRIAGNGLSATPRIVVNRWLTVIDQSNKANTTWYLLPEPTSPRPAVFAAFLAGHEEPDLRYRNDQGARPGGGSVDPSEGNFDADAVEYRVRHVVGGSQGFDEAVYVSTGS